MSWQYAEVACDKCAYVWIAVSPVTTEYLECPICKHMNPAPFVEEDKTEKSKE